MISFIIGSMENPDDRVFIETLYQNYKWLMFSKAKSYASNPSDQQDVVQNAMEKLIRNVATIRSMNHCKLACYIVYTIRSAAIDYLRMQKKFVEHDVSLEANEFSEPASPEIPLDDLIISSERLQLLQAIWPALSEEDHILLEGKYILGCKDEELALELGCNPSSIRMKLTRARRQAFDRLAEMEKV